MRCKQNEKERHDQGRNDSSLEGNTRRAIDIQEGVEIDQAAFKTLIRAAAALNKSKAR